MSQSKPLAHLKVLDFSAMYAGPICSRLLADCGADVIKVEAMGGGDAIRGPKGTTRAFAHFNAGKRSIAIDLKHAKGQAIARDLLKDADVLIENFRPGVMQLFKLDYATLKQERRDLVYCSISGFGQTGPMAQRAAYAPIAHAASGFDIAHQRTQKTPDADPATWSIMIGDMLTGAYAYGAIQTALLGRERTGRGDYIDVTMLESMISLIPNHVQTAQVPDARPSGGFTPVKTQDGFIIICIVSSKNLKCLCDAMGRPDMLTDERFAFGQHFRNSPEFIAEIESWSTGLSAAECEAQLNAAGVPSSTYTRPEDLFDHPQLKARHAFTEQEDEYGTFFIQNAPFQFASVATNTGSTTPKLGEHTNEILKERLACSEEAINALRDQKIVG